MKKTADNGTLLLRVLFVIPLALLLGAVCAGGIADAPAGVLRLCLSPEQLTLDAFTVAGVSGAFLNAALVGLMCCLVLYHKHEAVNSTSFMAYFLTVGFAFYGTNVLNILPCFLGTMLYSRVRRQPLGKNADFALFSTALAPFVIELLVRYPGDEIRAIVPLSVVGAVGIGMLSGFVMPAICGHSPNAHKGYSLYNAALPAGMLAFLFVSLLYKTRGIPTPANTSIGEGHDLFVNMFFILLFAAFALTGFWMNGRSLRGIGAIYRSNGYRVDFVEAAGFAPAMLHAGLYGLFILCYYNLAGASFNGVTMGVVFCMFSACLSGAHPLNVLPLLVGYALASTFSSWELSTTAIVVGACYSSGFAPVTGRFGFVPGILAGVLHSCAVTQMPQLHGGFCLYNGGLTCCVIAIVIAPLLESFFAPQDAMSPRPVAPLLSHLRRSSD